MLNNNNSMRISLLWLFAAIFYALEFNHRVNLSIILDDLSAEFSVHALSVANLSATFFYTYALMQIPAGYLLDNYSLKKWLTIAAVSIAIGSLLFAFSININVAYIARILIGFGSSFCFIASLKIAANYFPKNKFTLLVGIASLFGSIGGILGGAPLNKLIEIIGWRNTFLVHSFIALLFAVVFWLLTPKESSIRPRKLILHLNLSANNWLIIIYASLMILPMASYIELWGPKFLQETIGLSIEIAAKINSAAFGGIAVGGIIFGYIINRNIHKIALLGITLILTAVIYFMMITNDIENTLILSVLHFIFGFATSSMLISFSILTDQLPQNRQGLAIGYLNTFITLSNASGQTISGLLIGNTNNYLFGLAPLFICYLINIVVLTILFYKTEQTC